MAPGFFKKIGNFFKKVWDGTKKVFKKVAPVVKQVLPFLAPIIPGGGMIAPAIQTGIGIAEKFVDGKPNEGFQEIKRNITKLPDDHRLKRFFGAGGTNASINSPRIRLR